MTTEVEQQLQALIRRHGARKVHDALVPLIAKCKLDDWLCVANAVERIARKDSSHHTKGAAIRSGERIAWDWMKVIDDLRV